MGKKSLRGRTLKREIQRMQIVLEMAAALNSTLNYERVLNMALDLGTHALAETERDKPRIKCAILTFEDGRLVIAAARGMSHSDMRATLFGERGILGQAIANGEASFSSDPSRDRELRRLSAFHTTKSAVCIPLSIGLETYGLLLFGHPRSDYFKMERLELLETVAQQVMIALQNARLYSELEQEKKQMLDIHEEARMKLARDLHDGPTQSIAAIAMRTNFARRLMERDPKATANELFKIEELARKTTKEIRQMLFTLRPLILESEGLVAALEQLAEKTLEAHGQKVVVDAKANAADGLSIKKQGLIFSIAEEAVNNARKHAQAEQIWVRMEHRGQFLLLEIEDNGVGFNLGAVESNYEQRGSLGLLNLRERAELLSGQLRIETAPRRGTRIALTVPVTEKAVELLHRPGFAAQTAELEQASISH
ncbi:MAG: GAF domain-containing protein [Anaerolineales bacterium]|nr:GAF domain-containing protein [Anaerolineales bacterium]